MRRLVIVLGDQLDHASPAFDGFDPASDAAWMSETPEELTHVWCHKRRIAFFLAAMRHFRDELRARGWRVYYNELAASPDGDHGETFADLLGRDVPRLAPERLIVVEPGDWRVRERLRDAAAALRLSLELRDDESFLASRADFADYRASHRALLLENFYRGMRRRLGILVDEAGGPVGGAWNFDHENRRSFGRKGPGQIAPPPRLPPDETTRAVLALVAERFADHPGSLADFTLPVTRDQALRALQAFIDRRLPDFGAFQDAMWTGEPLLNHSALSAALNVKLIRPREVVDAALAAFALGRAPLPSVEGFLRQVIGWREFVRGVYFSEMPEYARLNVLDAREALPNFYWTGETEMNCLRQCLGEVIDHAYAHHIQRLMVMGLFALLWGVQPYAFHQWHMAMYVDAIDWVSLPNALGMSQHGDGGLFATKPYAASGAYINRMSNYFRGCRYDPRKSVGEDACPFTTLYWDFLARHRERFARNPRMNYSYLNVDRKDAGELEMIRRRAGTLRARAADATVF